MNDLERELQKTVENWQNSTFNHIQLNVVTKCLDDELIEYIESLDSPEKRKDFINDYSLVNEFEEYCNDNDLDKEDENSTVQFIESENEDNYYEFCNNDNYPMWNTLFETKYNDERIGEAAKKVGCGVIAGNEYFDTTIFMMSCGHSFYASYWIPMYLELYPDEAEKYKNVKYDHL